MNQLNLKYCDNIENNIYLYSTQDDQVQGIISIENKFIVPGTPVPREIMVYDDEMDTINLDNYVVIPALEGTIIRVFFYNDRWFVSTNKKLDASKSHWGSDKSFGHIFLENVFNSDSTIFSILDQNKIYLFFLKTDINTKIVCNQTDENIVSLFGVYDKIDSEIPSVQMPEILHDPANILQFKTIYDARVYVNLSEEKNITKQGLILFSKDSENPHIIKILDPKYKFLFDIRDNTPNVYWRFIEILLLQNKFILDKYIQVMYPERNDDFIIVTTLFYKMVGYIANAYIQRHVNFVPDVWVSPPAIHHFIEGMAKNIVEPNDYSSVKTHVLNIFKTYEGREIINLLTKFSY